MSLLSCYVTLLHLPYTPGNKNIHAITSSGNYELLIELEDFQQHTKTAHYQSFSVGDSASVYTLAVSGYNGTAGKSLDIIIQLLTNEALDMM